VLRATCASFSPHRTKMTDPSKKDTPSVTEKAAELKNEFDVIEDDDDFEEFTDEWEEPKNAGEEEKEWEDDWDDDEPDDKDFADQLRNELKKSGITVPVVAK